MLWLRCHNLKSTVLPRSPMQNPFAGPPPDNGCSSTNPTKGSNTHKTPVPKCPYWQMKTRYEFWGPLLRAERERYRWLECRVYSKIIKSPSGCGRVALAVGAGGGRGVGREGAKTKSKGIERFPYPTADHWPLQFLLFEKEGSAIYDQFSNLFSRARASPF